MVFGYRSCIMVLVCQSLDRPSTRRRRDLSRGSSMLELLRYSILMIFVS